MTSVTQVSTGWSRHLTSRSQLPTCTSRKHDKLTKSIQLEPPAHIDDLTLGRKLGQPPAKHLGTLIYIAFVIDQTRHGVHGLKPLPRLRMPLHIAVREQRPPVGTWVFPRIVPVGLGEFRIDRIHLPDHVRRVDAVHVRCHAHDRSMLPMQSDVVVLPSSLRHFEQVVESSEARQEWARYVSEG